ncbi:hypothetical protein BGZ82_002432 [Podila clonocystis]|nr:hypothetical protein BGZ82_002432 [Podila clonocystis]
MFYSNGGPAEIAKLWIAKRPQDPKLVTVAANHVVSTARKELSKLAKDKQLRFTRSNFSASNVDNFSLTHINQRLSSNAPLIFKVLQGFTSIATNSSRQQSLAVPVIGSILAFSRSRSSNYLQLMMGLYLYSAGCTRKVIDTLHGAGYCVSFPTVNRLLENLTIDAEREVKLAAKRDPFLLVYDNINFAKRKYDQRIGNTDAFVSGTTATMIIGKSLGSVHQIHDSYSRLCPGDFIIDPAEMAHFGRVFQVHLVEELKKNLDGYGHCSTASVAMHLLAAEKTKTYPLPIMKIDEASLEGNKMVVETVIEKALGLEAEWFTAGKMVVVAGDLATVKRLRGLKDLRGDHPSHYDRLDWIVPVAQLFHIQMMLANTILRNYRGIDTEQGSLEQLATLLGRKRVYIDNPEFHAVDEFLRHVFSAVVLRLWEASAATEEIQRQAGYTDGAIFSNFVNAKVERIVSQDLDPSKVKDPSSANATLFLRDMLIYVELSSAIKTGDIGRIGHVLKWLTVITQAGYTTQYAYELMHFRCCFVHLWDQDTKVAILSSMLVNTTGTRNGWKPTDLYQEHCNRSIKHVYRSRRGDTSFDTLRERISMNIETLDNAKTQTEEQFRVPRNKRKHAAVSAEPDVAKILTILSENGILDRDQASSTRQDPTVKRARDLFGDGMIALQDKKRMQTFIKKYTDGIEGMGGAPEVTAVENPDDSDRDGELEDYDQNNT